MNGSGVVGSRERARVLNAVPLQNAVLCAECDVVSDSPHDVCLVCVAATLYSTLLEFLAGTFRSRGRPLLRNNRPKRHVKAYWSFPNLTGPGGGRLAHVNSPSLRSTIISRTWSTEC
jgi:hypothetical protein